MKRWIVIWVHVRGGSNTEYVNSPSAESAKTFIENRMGAANITKIIVKPFI